MTKDRKGIVCDVCGDEARGVFTYYSANFDEVKVAVDQQKVGVVDADKRTLELDFCEKCYGNMKAKVLEVIDKKGKEPKSKKSEWS
ncbi:MAG: hypothetical protein ACXADH_12310 [Candidatus Kariarchaeaceae archaeon]